MRIGRRGIGGNFVSAEAFDQSKLEVNVSSYDLNGFVVAYFDVSYDGKDFESGSRSSKGGQSFYALRPMVRS